MTYRYMPQRARLIAQLVTLIGTAGLGVSIALTPLQSDPKLSEIEKAMQPDTWAYMLIAFGLVGFIAEIYQTKTKGTNLFWLVSLCHIMCMSLLIGYSASALVSLVRTGFWWNFGAPLLGGMIAVWHYVYIRRKPHRPLDLDVEVLR